MDFEAEPRYSSPKRGLDEAFDDDLPPQINTPPLLSSPGAPISRPGSPSKRTRSIAPPVHIGPLAFNIQGDLEPKYAPPNSCSRPGVHRILPPDASVRVHLSVPAPRAITCNVRTVLAAADRKYILLFTNDLTNIAAVCERLLTLPVMQNLAMLVSNAPLSAQLPVPMIEDSMGTLARECRVLDPLGGGRVAADCLVMIRDGEVQATTLLGRPFEDIARNIDGFASI